MSSVPDEGPTLVDELRDALGSVKIEYEGPPVSRKIVREIERGVMLALDGLGVPDSTPKEVGVQEKTILGGVLSISVRVPIDLLRQRKDRSSLPEDAITNIERKAYAMALRSALASDFKAWRKQAGVDDES